MAWGVDKIRSSIDRDACRDWMRLLYGRLLRAGIKSRNHERNHPKCLYRNNDSLDSFVFLSLTCSSIDYNMYGLYGAYLIVPTIFPCTNPHRSCMFDAITSSRGKLVIFQREIKSSRLTIAYC